MSNAALVVALANARSARRPTGARAVQTHDALADPASATGLLGPFLDDPITADELAPLRALQEAVVAVVEALIGGSEPSLESLNALARRNPVVYVLDERLRPTIRPGRSSSAATLLIEVIRELGELEPSRLRRCARPECGLVFYDGTRSATRRWHAERPCGLRERQRRHRAKHA